ncbi:MAG: Dna2/Cas4 domain-containing protein [Chloroflexi bacterium]|nr:MAG: Dna2/Cas4 domain-containing protein [Chloroflexota bacterium]
MYVRNVPDSIPISALNTLEYCPRRFYYQFVQSDMVINEFVLEGTLLHRRVNQAGTQTVGQDVMQTTRLYLYSEELRLSGFTDVIEEQGGLLIPVEYKHGQQGEWLNDAIAALEKPPSPLEPPLTARCPNCSLVSLCLPDEVKLLRSRKEKALANTLPD